MTLLNLLDFSLNGSNGKSLCLELRFLPGDEFTMRVIDSFGGTRPRMIPSAVTIAIHIIGTLLLLAKTAVSLRFLFLFAPPATRNNRHVRPHLPLKLFSQPLQNLVVHHGFLPVIRTPALELHHFVPRSRQVLGELAEGSLFRFRLRRDDRRGLFDLIDFRADGAAKVVVEIDGGSEEEEVGGSGVHGACLGKCLLMINCLGNFESWTGCVDDGDGAVARIFQIWC
mmetsp:Transcript_13147/g.27018  ORF Transcript_13147/g.27018 Transcript_13147/m.27018 type:complete len:226 (-) Transcript_13147:132-809(-)